MEFIGVSVRDHVLGVADLLKQPSAPGVVTLALAVALVLSSVIYVLVVWRRRSALRWFRGRIERIPAGVVFGQSADGLTADLGREARSQTRRQVFEAWCEYRETFVVHDEEEGRVLRNSVRPSNFFNADDLGFSTGFWRILPGLFVSVGLFLTFLGLISALHAMDLEASKVADSLKDLLTIASAKFIMSLTGLFCSIVFTIVLRIGMGRLEAEIHAVCRSVEKRLTFISLEDLASEQLRATRDQREHLQKLAIELVAELGRPLREELPAAISSSIATAMAPLLGQIGQMSSDGMGAMVSNLSSQLSDEVSRALAEASHRLAEAGDRIGGLAERFDQSSGRMGAEMDTAVTRLAQAVDDLRQGMSATAATASGALTEGAGQMLSVMNRTLEGIRDNTAEGARAMSAAAGDLKAAAEGFRGEIERATREGADAARASLTAAGAQAGGAIDAAGKDVLDAFGRTSGEIARLAETLADKTGRDLLAPLDKVADRFGGLIETLSEGTRGMHRLSDGIKAGSEATESAATAFRTAAKDLVDATAPIRATNERLETSVRGLADSTRQAVTVVTTSAETTARAGADVLSAAREALGGQGRAIEAALAGVSTIIDKMRQQSVELDRVDEKLVTAFEAYERHVAASVSTLFEHVKAMNDRLAPALDTMREIVEQAEQFAPESRRR